MLLPAVRSVIFDIAASRLVREDSAAASVELIRKNLQTVGAADSIPAVDALAAQLSAIPAAQIAERSAKADEILEGRKGCYGCRTC